MSKCRNLSRARLLTASDAEALLLVLGASLEWGDSAQFAKHLDHDAVQCQTAAVDVGFYCVYVKKGRRTGWLATWQSLTPNAVKAVKDTFCPDSFDTQVEAKAACERHNRTGEWK